MPHLPSALESLSPVLQRSHRFASRQIGAVTRAVSAPPQSEAAGSPAGPPFPRPRRAQATSAASRSRAVPRSAYLSSADAAAAEDSIALRYGGPAEQVSRHVPEGLPAGSSWQGAATIPPRFVLEMCNGQAVGTYSAHVSAAGMLDLETSPYPGVHSWREHPIFLRPLLPIPSRVPGRLLSLSTPGSGADYYHFLMDLLPRWATYQEACPGPLPDYLLVDTHTGHAQQLLEMLGLDETPTLSPTRHSAFRADRLLVPSIGNQDMLAPPWNTRWLRRTLPPSGKSGLPTRIYLTRSAPRGSRRVTNEEALLSVLRPLGFTTIDPGELSVQEQIDAFAAAEVVVSPHDVALANLNFAPEGVRVLELFHPRRVDPRMWAITSNVAESRYRQLVGTAQGSDLAVDLDEVRGLLDDLLR